MRIFVIGGGIAGYSSAIRASQLGAKVTVIEKKNIGGVCLNEGCIPVKTILHAANIWHLIQKSNDYGIQVSEVNFHANNLVSRTKQIIEKLRNGLSYILDSYNIDISLGNAVLDENGKVILDSVETAADRIIIATGTLPVFLEEVDYSHPCIWNVHQAVNPAEIPRRIVIVGSGAVGIELAVFYRTMGADVVVIESEDQMLPNILDQRTAKEAASIFERKKIQIFVSSKIKKVVYKNHNLTLMVNDKQLYADKLIIAVGYKPNTENINANIALGESGEITTDKQMRTNIENIFAAGDITGKPYLAHKAMEEGIVAAENAMGYQSEIDYKLIPNCIYTIPEIATIGKMESGKNDHTKVRFPFSANGKAIISGDTQGFIQLIIETGSRRIIGAKIIGPNASELIHVLMLAIKADITADKLGSMMFAHPTFSEAIKESARIFQKNAIHFAQIKSR